MTTKPEDALVELIEELRDPEYREEVSISAAVGERAADAITTLLERERRATVLLRGIVGNANEAMPFGPFDCVDNTGEPYQSEAFAQALRAGRDHLARAALAGDGV